MGVLSTVTRIFDNTSEVESAKVKLREYELSLSHQERMTGIKADLTRDLINAVIGKRVDAVQATFMATLTMYADQCRHYMAQQNRYADAEIKATAPIERANLRSRIAETDMQLGNCRMDAAGLYREMTRSILLIGGTMPVLSKEDEGALMLMKRG